MLVRPATLDDLPDALAALAAVGLPVSGAVAAARIAASREGDGAAQALVAVDDDRRIAGGVAFDVIPSLIEVAAIARVLIMAVHPDFQRRGIGRLLMDAVERHAWAHGCGRIEVIAGFQRVETRGFYGSIGYRAVNDRLVKRREK